MRVGFLRVGFLGRGFSFAVWMAGGVYRFSERVVKLWVDGDV